MTDAPPKRKPQFPPCPACGRKGLHYPMHAHASGYKEYSRLECRFCHKRFVAPGSGKQDRAADNPTGINDSQAHDPKPGPFTEDYKRARGAISWPPGPLPEEVIRQQRDERNRDSREQPNA